MSDEPSRRWRIISTQEYPTLLLASSEKAARQAFADRNPNDSIIQVSEVST